MKRLPRAAALLLAGLLALSPAALALEPPVPRNYYPERAEAYAAYQQAHPAYSEEQAVTLVNIGLNRPFYTDIADVGEPDALLVLVNKYHRLPSDYVPNDLTTLRYGNGATLRAEAAAAFDDMAAAARRDGVVITGVSGYRSYGLQQSLYSRYSAQDGTAAADRYSARPGHSEHQTGLAIDVSNGGVYTQFGGTAAHSWALKHLHEYGFIIRYTKANEWITGYKDEAWHFRYVGVDAATEIYHLGVTLEEYLDRYVYPTGASTAKGESVTAAQCVLSSGKTTPFHGTQVTAQFSNVLVPVTGTLQWQVDGAAIGAEASFSLANGAVSTLLYLPPGRTHTVSLRLTAPTGEFRVWQAIVPVGGDCALFSGLSGITVLAPVRQAGVWRAPAFAFVGGH